MCFFFYLKVVLLGPSSCGGPKGNHYLRGPFLRVFSLFSPRGNIFFFAFSYKSFPFYNWTFGAYLIFINVNPLVSGTKKKGPEGNHCLQGSFLRVFSLFSPRVNKFFFKKFSYKSFPFYDWPFGAYLIFIIAPLVSGTKKKGPEGNHCLRGPFLTLKRRGGHNGPQI